MIKIINNNFEQEVLNNSKVVLVDFYANWCGPCKMLTPILENISQSRSTEFDIMKVDVDKEEDIAKTYSIFTIPTMIIFKNGVEMKRLNGYMNEEEIMNELKNYL